MFFYCLLLLPILICNIRANANFETGKSLLANEPVGLPVFRNGESGYPCIRTPAIIKTNSSLLAFAGTRCGAGDGCNPHDAKTVDHMDTVMKRSMDNGKTWSSIRSIYSASCEDRDHGTPVYDELRNRVVLVFRGKDLLTWTMYSDDDGETWSKPSQINLDKYNTSRVSPGRGLQLSSTNKHAPGRLVFVAQMGVKGRSSDIVYYSDDGGITWRRSQSVIDVGNEAQIVELPNSTLLMNARVEVKSKETSRLFAISDDGGVTWKTVSYRYDIAAVTCMGSTISTLDSSGKPILLYSHPASMRKPRRDGAVWISEDEGTSWSHFKSVNKGKGTLFAYSCMSETMKPDTIGLLYETEDPSRCDGPSCQILYTEFQV